MYREGWGVVVIPIWDHEGESVYDIEVEVVRLSPATEVVLGNTLCVRTGMGGYVPMDNFEKVDALTTDDTHDLRLRYFESEPQAREHAEYTRNRWANPSPWESFVQL